VTSMHYGTTHWPYTLLERVTSTSNNGCLRKTGVYIPLGGLNKDCLLNAAAQSSQLSVVSQKHRKHSRDYVNIVINFSFFVTDQSNEKLKLIPTAKTTVQQVEFVQFVCVSQDLGESASLSSFLQGVSGSCKPCTSYDRDVCPSVRLSVRPSHADIV